MTDGVEWPVACLMLVNCNLGHRKMNKHSFLVSAHFTAVYNPEGSAWKETWKQMSAPLAVHWLWCWKVAFLGLQVSDVGSQKFGQRRVLQRIGRVPFFKVYVTGLIFDLKKKWKCTQDYVYRFCEHK